MTEVGGHFEGWVVIPNVRASSQPASPGRYPDEPLLRHHPGRNAPLPVFPAGAKRRAGISPRANTRTLVPAPTAEIPDNRCAVSGMTGVGGQSAGWVAIPNVPASIQAISTPLSRRHPSSPSSRPQCPLPVIPAAAQRRAGISSRANTPTSAPPPTTEIPDNRCAVSGMTGVGGQSDGWVAIPNVPASIQAISRPLSRRHPSSPSSRPQYPLPVIPAGAERRAGISPRANTPTSARHPRHPG